jgi:Tfp pilus assembly PilM family ATPase
MNILSIDLGTYSIKFTTLRSERKALVVEKAHEILLDDIRDQYDDELNLYQLQLEIVRDYIGQNTDAKIVMQLPNEFITTRYLALPVAQRKKAEQIIPFQLDENLPYPSSDAHFFTIFEKKGTGSEVLVNITKKSDFEKFFDLLSSSSVPVSVLTSEVSLYQTFASEFPYRKPFAIIDIGHTTAKCFLFLNGKMISNHISYTAGHVIDEVIAETYQISLPEAVEYKHANCFFLTDNQYDEVDEQQRDFAKLMKKSFGPLIQDIKRWLLGFRVKNGPAIEKVFITGGSSNIKNINNFIAQSVSIPVEFLNLGDKVIDEEDALEEGGSSFALSSLMGITQRSKKRPGNFLVGPYSLGNIHGLPLHSTAFVLSRVAVVSLIFCLFLGGEAFILNKKNQALDKKIKKILKTNKTFAYTKRQRRKFAKDPKRLLNDLKKRQKVIRQEVKSIMSSSRIDALTPLSKISSLLTEFKEVELTSFESERGEVYGTIYSKDPDSLDEAQVSLKAGNFTGLSLKPSSDGNSVKFSFTE